MGALIQDQLDRLRVAEIGDTCGFPLQWHSTPDAILENGTYGSIRQRIVMSASGEPKYDFPHVIEPGGAALLPINLQREVGLVLIDRPALLKPEPVGTYPDFEVPGDFGRVVWEAPRGYRNAGEDTASTAIREFTEETGMKILDVEYVGSAAPNSAFLATPLELFLGDVDSTTRAEVNANEGIRELRFFDLNGIRELSNHGDLVCAITLSLIAHALMRGRIG